MRIRWRGFELPTRLTVDRETLTSSYGKFIAEAMKACSPGDKECLVKALENVNGYQSVLNSKGFKNRVLQLDTKIYEFRDSKWEEVE